MTDRATDSRYRDDTDNATYAQAPGAQADKPGQIPPRGWFQVLRRAFAEMGRDHITLIAGGVAYSWFLALFPGLIAAVMIYGLVTDPAQVQQQVASFSEGLPQSAQSLLADQMSTIAQGSASNLSIGLAVSLALALWSASAGMAGLVEAVNIAYDEQENRNLFVKRGLALLLTLGFIVFLAVSVSLVAVLPVVLGQLGLGVVITVVVQVMRWVALVVLMTVALALLYRVGPDRDSAKFTWISRGAVAATILWVLASVGFSFYVDNFGSYGETYGSLAGVIVLLLWLWITATVVLLGAEINSEAEAQTARDTTKGAAKPMGQRDAVKADEPPPARS